MWLDVQPPAIKVEVIGVTGMSGVSPIKADNIELPIFYPDSSSEQPTRRFFFWLNIDHKASCFAKKFLPNIGKVVIALLEVSIEHHHLRETARQESVCEARGDH